MDRRLTTINAKSVVYFILYWTIISDVLIAELKFPSSIQYLNDIGWCFLLLFIIRRGFLSRFKSIGAGSIGVSLVVHLLICYISALLNLVNPFLLIWASRNTLRFFVFYIGVILYFDIDDIERLFNVFYYLQLISFGLALYQYFGLGYKQDLLGGIFGHGNGAALNVFQAMIAIYYLCTYLNKKTSIRRIVVILATSIIIAALAEEKAFFVYLLISVVACILLNRPSLKTIIAIVLLMIFVPYGIQILVGIMGDLGAFSSLEALIEYGEGAYGLSRINPFSQINRLFFDNSIFKNLFGIGFGGAELCSVADIFQSDFANKYMHLQYFDFVHQKKFIETGYLGFGSFVLFLLLHTFFSFKIKVRNKINSFGVHYAIVFPIICCVSCWMSGSLIFNDGFIPFFGLASALIYATSGE